jgi:hypothetical protein
LCRDKHIKSYLPQSLSTGKDAPIQRARWQQFYHWTNDSYDGPGSWQHCALNERSGWPVGLLRDPAPRSGATWLGVAPQERPERVCLHSQAIDRSCDGNKVLGKVEQDNVVVDVTMESLIRIIWIPYRLYAIRVFGTYRYVPVCTGMYQVHTGT